MRNIFLSALIVISSALCFYAGYSVKQTKEYKVQDIFFDGEGNQIPNEVVQLFVTSQFVKITDSEKKQLNEYFYNNK